LIRHVSSNDLSLFCWQRADFEEVRENALRRAENHGIIFLDEIDKLANGTEYVCAPSPA
jgi:ATP-dependent protease HslVU (ClpYQ) ATPase subunit